MIKVIMRADFHLLNEYMVDEFDNINSRLPDLGSMLAQRIISKKTEISGNSHPDGTFDPYLTLINKKKSESSDIDQSTVKTWPIEAIEALQSYCKKMGINGFNSGHVHPLVALKLLKDKFGDDYTDVPLNERIPKGYEQIGEKSKYNSNYPYSTNTPQKQIIHG